MPYIPKEDRPRVASEGPLNPGELNYALTLHIRCFMREAAPLKYHHINHVVAAVEAVKRKLLDTSRRWGIADPLEASLFQQCRAYCIHGRPVDEAVGALECCKLEFYRRVAVPYEDMKIKANGDVY